MTKFTGKKRKYICEELEPRILLSAGVEGLVYDSGWEPDVTLEPETDAAQIIALFNNNQESSEPTLEVVFVDASLPDYQSIIDDLTENDDENRIYEIVLLTEQDGISQITSYLDSQDNIDAIHFITHGEDGVIQLGNTQLDLNTIEDYSSELLLWQNSLDENADILFYGCDIVSSDAGLNLIQQISVLTGADVAASDDTTGNTQLGGDWDLETNIGTIETNIALSSDLQMSWKGILPVVTFQDGVNGYTGTIDTQIDELNPDTIYGTSDDGSVDGGPLEIQGLIQFDDIFGNGPGQIPYGSTIISATLTFNVDNGSAGNALIELHVVDASVNWDESDTWTTLNDGISVLDGTDAAIAADSTLGAPMATGAQTFSGLESTLQAVSDGGTDNGWVITNSTTNDWDFNTSEDSTIGLRPVLTIEYTTNVDPVITSSATASVTENTPAATTILTVTATDGDGDIPTFSITGGTADDALFSITAGGVLTFDAAPDFESPGDIGGDNTYNIQVTADDGNGGLTTQNIAISVTNTNEGSPVFTSSTTQSVVENTTAVTTVAATDADINDVITYSITGGTADDTLFNITAGGVLTFATAPDFESPGDIGLDNTYNIQVTADDGNGGLTTQNIAISVTNTNEGSPVFTSSSTQSVVENTTAVTTVAATDVDTNDVITYSITGGTADDTLFSITAGGVLTFDTAPDFENPGDIGLDNTYNIQVTADDGNGGLTTQNIAISVTNTNEGVPSFTSSATQSVVENSTAVTTVAATDVDTNDVITYSITGGTADDALFSITAGGVLTFDTAPDFENPGDIGLDNTYNIEVTADDGNGGLTTQNITISVTNTNEGSPVFTSSSTQSVVENTTAVTTVAATDADINDVITYSITGGTADDALFSITAGGVLTFDTAPDFENPGDIGLDNTYNIEVTADDGNGGLTTQNIAISVTNINETPTLDPVASPSVPENTTAVTTATASDVDAGDSLVFSISGTDSGLFSIDGVTGVITFNTAPNFESPGDSGADNVYDLQVTVTDLLGATSSQLITVTVTNVNEVPTIDDQQFSVSGDSVNGSPVGIVTASDLDAGDTLSYSITDGTGIGSFAIDSNTGLLTISNSNSLTSDVAQVYTLSVLVTDSSGNTSTSTISISVAPSSSNNNPVVVSPPPTEQTNPSPERVDFIAEPTLQLAGYIFNSHLITPFDPTTDNSENNSANENLGVADSRDVKVDWLTSAENKSGSDYLSYRSGGAFYNALDKMTRDIDEAAEDSSNNILTAGVRGTGIALTAGFASWVLRGTSLLASFLSTIPVWRGLDPLPILAAARKKQKDDVYIANSKKSESDADDIDDIFDEKSNKSNNPVQEA